MKTTNRVVHLLGYACALGGVNLGCSKGPLLLRESLELNHLLSELALAGLDFRWEAMLEPRTFTPEDHPEELRRLCQILALKTAEFTANKEFFMVTGGDHTSAIGTWSGVRQALAGPLGLIWVDAHMDSHTPETTESGRLHGMPLASLMGYGDQRFVQLLSPQPKIKPEHLCLIGVRSFEPGEAKLLETLKVRVYFMDEVKRRGLAVIFEEAKEIVTRGTAGYGLSLDLDSLDPQEAPGVDVPEPDGLKVKELNQALKQVAGDPRLLGVEIVEFNPTKDINQLTEKAIVELIRVWHA